MSGISFSRTTVLTVVMIVEVVVVLFFVFRWYSRKWGWRPTFRRIRGYVWTTLSDLARPAAQLFRFGRDIRAIAAQMNDSELNIVLHRATAVAGESLSAEPDARCYAALVSPRNVALAVAGPVELKPPAPWTNQNDWWAVSRTAVTPGPADSVDPGLIGYVAIGAEPAGVTLLNLEQAPGVIEVAGPRRATLSLIWGLAAQLLSGLAGGDDIEVIVTAGVHPHFEGQRLRTVLGQLQARSDGGRPATRQTVLFCGLLEPGDAELVTTLTRTWPALRVVTAGPYPGRRWKLPITPEGRIEAPELGLCTDSAPLERAVARALKHRARQERLINRRRPRPAAPAEASRPDPVTDVTMDMKIDMAEPDPAELVLANSQASDGSVWEAPATPAISNSWARPEDPEPVAFARSNPDDGRRARRARRERTNADTVTASPRSSSWDLDEPDPAAEDLAGQSASSAPRYTPPSPG